MSIVYSTFIVVMTYLVIFPIYYLQQDVLVKASVQFLIINAANCLLILVFYGPKLVVIVFKAHKNNRAYVQQKMMANSFQQIEITMKNRVKKDLLADTKR